MALIFPSLPGLAWSVTKSPTFQTRIQRAVSGRELRALDYPYPLWQFTLVFDFLRDNPAAGYNELRTLLGFFLLCQGAFANFVFNDPTDNSVTFQVLPAAVSTLTGTATLAAAGTAYTVGDIVSPSGGTISAIGGAPTSWSVASISGPGPTGPITGLTLQNPGSYAVVPGVTNIPLTGGTGTGGQVSVSWLTRVQLVRTMGDASLPGTGFAEAMSAPNVVSKIYFNGITQPMTWTVDSTTGIVTLPIPFFGTQPVISADFTYYFRCRFIDDRYDFENFMLKLWTLKKLTFISVRP
jgi:hypothetical protein